MDANKLKEIDSENNLQENDKYEVDCNALKALEDNFWDILQKDSVKLCVVGNPKLKTTRTTKYCDLLEKSKKTPVSCLYAADRLECLLAISRKTADFSVFEAEDLYFSTLWHESSLLVVSEIRALKKKAFRFGLVAMVRKDSNITGIADLKGKRLCHPGLESSLEWNYLFAQYFEERVAPANCDKNLSVYEDRIKTTSDFIGSACKAGPWSANAEEDARLKNKYWNLCRLCEGGDCGSSDKYRGSGGSLICFKDGIGDVLWAKYEDVIAHIRFLESESSGFSSDYYYLCDDGTLMSLTSEEPCFWLAKPWQVVGANRKSSTDVQKIVDALSDDERNDWEENLLHVIELYFEYIQNLIVSRTPEDYLRGIPGYLSASAMSQGNCKPMHSVNLCVTSAIEEHKCDWMSKAGSALGIQPPLQCVQKANFTACLNSVAEKEADVISVPPDFLHDAAIKYKLRNFLLETGNNFDENYLSSVIVKKKSGLKKLEDLKRKKICITRRHGIGWWSLLSALNRQSLIDSPCPKPSDYFGDICVVNNQEMEKLGVCCPKDSVGDDEANVLYCLHKDGCDAAVLDFNTLKENTDGRNSEDWSKDLKFSDFRVICGSGTSTDCHWMWGNSHYLMTYAETSSPKGVEIFNVFFQLGQYFGKNSQKNNLMLEIFAPFHEVKNVLFRDTSATFIKSNLWNRSGNFLNTLDYMKFCSKSSPKKASSFMAFFLILIVSFTSHNTDFYLHLKLISWK